MAYTDRTLELRKSAQEKLDAIPPNKRRRVTKPSARSRTESGVDSQDALLRKQFMGDAYTIVSHKVPTHGSMS